jgi:uncharacterized membrane protein
VYDWLLALHILSAASLVAAVILYSVVIVGTRGIDRPSTVARYFRLVRVGDVLMPIGSLGVLIFGIWLAIDVDAYHVWDGWVIAAIVLWAILGGIGGRLGKLYNSARDRARKLVAEGRDEPDAELRAVMTSQTGLVLMLVSILVLILFFVVMIYKPGA